MGQQASVPPPELPLPRASAWLRKEIVTGHLLRHVPRWRQSRRWAWHEAILDGEVFQTTTWPSSEERDLVPLKDVLSAEAVALAAPRALFTPEGARAKAPQEEAEPAGFLLHIRGGNEILLCARSLAERQRWLDALSTASEQLRASELMSAPTPDACSLATDAATESEVGAAASDGAETPKARPAGAPVVVEQGAIGAGAGEVCGKGAGKGPGKGPGKGAGKGAGKGKGKPAPGPPPKAGASPKAGLPPKAPGAGPKRPAVPKLHGFVQKDSRTPKETANTIFHSTGATPRLHYDLNTFVASGQSSTAKVKSLCATKAQEDRTRLLDDKVAQAVGVAMARLDAPAVVAAIEALDPGFGGQRERLLDGAENLHEVLVGRKDRDPLGRIREYLQRGGDPAALRSIERSLLPLAQVPRAAQRLQLILLLATMPERLERARRQLALLVDTARDVEKCRLLKEVVRIIQVAMAWNTGASSNGSQHVFNVGEQLQRLKTIKPPGSMGGRTFVHWMAEELMVRSGWSLGSKPFASEVPNLQLAAKTNPALVYEELQRVKQGSRLAASEFEEHFCAYSLLQPPPSAAAAATTVVHQPALAPVQPPAKSDDKPALGAVEPAATERGEVKEEGKSGPLEFRLSNGLDPPLQGLDSSAGLETFDMDAPGGRLTELCGRPAFMQPRPPAASSWDTRRLPKGVRIRRLAFYRQGTFAKASRCSPVSADLGLARPSGASVDSTEAGLQGFIYILLPHKTRQHSWERCWADLRSHHLVVRRANGRSLGREVALPLPGAEVLPLECLFASELSGWLASQRACGFELRGLPFDGGRRRGGPFVARVEGAAAAERWERALRAETERHGVGALWVCSGGRFGRWERRWCVVDFEMRRLCCFARPLDHLLGQEPRRVLQLPNASLRSIDGVGGAPLPPDVAGAFELEELFVDLPGDGETSSGWWSSAETVGCPTSFAVDSPEALKRWLAALQAVCGTACLRNSYCAPLDLGDTPPGRPRGEDDSNDGDSPFAQLARQRPSFARALHEATPGRGPRCVDLLAACQAAVAAEDAVAAEPASADTSEAPDGASTAAAAGAVGTAAAGVAEVAQGRGDAVGGVPGDAACRGETATGGVVAESSDGVAAVGSRRPEVVPRLPVPPLALGAAVAGGVEPVVEAEGRGDHSDSEASFDSTDSERTFKTAASRARSTRSGDSDDSATEEEGEEPGVVGQLRRLGRQLRAEATSLEEEVKAGEFAAQTTLQFFNESPPPGGALAQLQTFLDQIASFARDFGAAAEEVARRESSKAKAHAKAQAKAQAKAPPSSPPRRVQLGRGARAAAPAAPPDAVEPQEGGGGERRERPKLVVTQPLMPPQVPVHVGGS